MASEVLQRPIDANGHAITNLPTPADPSDAARLQDIGTPNLTGMLLDVAGGFVYVGDGDILTKV
jgi:hypothetical protein